MIRAWNSIKRTIKSYRWMLVIYILKMLPNSRLLDFPIRAYFILSAAKTQPLPIMVSFILISFTDYARTLLEFATLVKSAVREIPLMYRLSENPTSANHGVFHTYFIHRLCK